MDRRVAVAIVNVSEEDRSLKDLVERVRSGESVEIAADGQVVARLVPVEKRQWTVDFAALERLRASSPKSSMTVEEMRRLDLL